MDKCDCPRGQSDRPRGQIGKITLSYGGRLAKPHCPMGLNHKSDSVS